MVRAITDELESLAVPAVGFAILKSLALLSESAPSGILARLEPLASWAGLPSPLALPALP